jgi:hypothetical protein
MRMRNPCQGGGRSLTGGAEGLQHTTVYPNPREAGRTTTLASDGATRRTGVIYGIALSHP